MRVNLVGSQKSIGIFAVIWFACFFGLLQLDQRPDVVPKTAPASQFSAERAWQHLKKIAAVPHPPGTQAHAEVVSYLYQQLSALGLETSIQSGVRPTNRSRAIVRIKNVIGILIGTSDARPILFAAHHDSVANSPGAGDNGSSVAALLEVVRALKAGPPLKRDIIFLFTDAEESRLLGAELFAEESPLLHSVEFAFNFDARGGGGQPIVFETGKDNRDLIAEAAKAAPNLRGNSLATALYDIMPNLTDFTVFKTRASGLNIAFLDHSYLYHSALDTIQNLDPQSLQLQGDYALELARHFGKRPSTKTRKGDATFFDLPFLGLIHYPPILDKLITLACCLLWAILFRRDYQANKTQMTRTILACLGSVLVFAIIAASLFVILYGLKTFHPASLQYSIHPPDSTAFLPGFWLTCLVMGGWVMALLGKRLGSANLINGTLLLAVLILVTLAILLPAGSWLLNWPLLCGLAARFLIQEGQERRTFLGLSLAGIPALFFFVPVTEFVFIALPFDTAMFSMLLGGAMILCAIPAIWLMVERLPKFTPLLGLLIITAAVIIAVNPRSDELTMKRNQLFYMLEPDHHHAFISTNVTNPGDQAKAVLGDTAKRSKLPRILNIRSDVWNQTMPAVDLPAPEIQIIDVQTTETERRIHLAIKSLRNAPILAIRYEDKATLIKATLDGYTLRIQDNQFFVEHMGGTFDEPARLFLRVQGHDPITIQIADHSPGLPQIPGITWPTDTQDATMNRAIDRLRQATGVWKEATF